jgi:hypothetical protein
MFNRNESRRNTETSCLKKRAALILFILMSVFFLFTPLSIVLGQQGVSIILVSPQEMGVVGQEVNVQGTIETSDGEYQIWFGDRLIVSNSSEGYYVNTNFTIPELPGGDYSITLRDFSKNINDTYPFTVSVAYYIEALELSSPAQLQEGSDVVVNVRVTGIQSDTSYYANVTVALPAPLSTRYSQAVELAVSNQAVAAGQVTYPSAAFQPEGAHTNYTGSYKVYFNETQMLGAEDQFFVGFTDSNEYHRGGAVAIQAIGYQPDENASLSIKYAETGVSVHSETVTASSGGIINSSWTVPSDALIGDYNITITPENTAKTIPDSQLFTIPGYSVKIQTLNLAGEPVPQIEIDALDRATNKVYNGTSGSDGIASLNLEDGNHAISAFWNGVKVGEINATVTGENTFDLMCELTNLEITVQNKNGDLIPFVNLDITYQYVTTKGSLKEKGRTSGQTGLSGTFVLNSSLPRVSYVVNASLYGVAFNADNNTVTNLPAQPIYNVIILCPSRSLTLRIIDYNMAVIPDARIELFEVTSGLFNSATTDAAGTLTVEVTFGKYRLRVYKDDILLNETVVQGFSDTQIEIHCSLYNIKVSVKVVDYFEQPIPNINVRLQGPGVGTLSDTTHENGIVTFSDVIGGNMQIIAYPEGVETSYEALNLQVEEPTTIQIQMSKYILLGPFLIESNMLTTLIIILVAVILFVSIEVHMRKQAKSSE